MSWWEKSCTIDIAEADKMPKQHCKQNNGEKTRKVCKICKYWNLFDGHQLYSAEYIEMIGLLSFYFHHQNGIYLRIYRKRKQAMASKATLDIWALNSITWNCNSNWGLKIFLILSTESKNKLARMQRRWGTDTYLKLKKHVFFFLLNFPHVR